MEIHFLMLKPRFLIVQYTKLQPEHVASTVLGWAAMRSLLLPVVDRGMTKPVVFEMALAAVPSTVMPRKFRTSTPMSMSTSFGVGPM